MTASARSALPIDSQGQGRPAWSWHSCLPLWGGKEKGGCLPLGGEEEEKEKVVGGAGELEPQACTVLSMVPLGPQRAEMQPPVPSVVW